MFMSYCNFHFLAQFDCQTILFGMISLAAGNVYGKKHPISVLCFHTHSQSPLVWVQKSELKCAIVCPEI